MTITGPDALKALQDALRDIRREEDEIARRLARGSELLSRLREQEGELLRQLAASRLDEATEAAISGALAGAAFATPQAARTHAEELGAIQRRLRVLDEACAAVVAERATLQADAARRHHELERLTADLRPRLAGDDDYARSRAEAERLAAIASESLRKTVDAEAAREIAGRPYRDDPLFMYLWTTGYGTAAYRANPLRRALDGRVARLVGYDTARANFAMLNDLPLRLREHAEDQQQQARAAAEALAALESAALETAGGRTARDALEALVGAVADLDARLVGLEDERDALAAEQLELAGGGLPAPPRDALDLLFRRADVRDLLAEARLAGGEPETAIIRQIDDVRQRLKDEADENADQRERLTTLAVRRRDLEDIEYEFKQRGFDNPRSSFSNVRLVGELLNEFLRGGRNAASYWGDWQRAQSWPGVEAGTACGGPAGGWGRLPPPAGRGGPFSRPRATPAAISDARRQLPAA